jgi:hypothetical protein
MMPMLVGVNYPWCDYGWDFGLGPPAWRGSRSAPRWFDHVDDHLDRFRQLGIAVVRWFILADGLTYGTALEAPAPDPFDPGRWRFEPPALADDLLQHFDELLRRFEATRTGTRPPIRLLPVLIDFHFCEPGVMPVPLAAPGSGDDPGWVKQGRADAVLDAAPRRRFLDGALDPLLEISRRRPDVVFAWELINEPDLITQGWRGVRTNAPVPADAMRAFLAEGASRIRRAGFKTSVGFASIDGLRRSGVTADVNQFHYYPSGRRPLEPHPFDPAFPGIIGEFATTATDVWPDLRRTGQSLLNRLRLADARGYPLALLWSFLAHDRHTDWSESVEVDLQAFAQDSDG